MLQTKILLLGPDSVGKTKLLYKLKLNEDVKTIPTMGFNIETINYKDREINIWDMGGASLTKNSWHKYFRSTNCIVFVIDISKKDRLDEYLKTFNFLLLQHENYRSIPIIIFGNKYNDITEFEPEELLQISKIPPEISPYIIKGNVVAGEGLQEFLDYIYNNMEFNEKKEEQKENEESKKNKKAQYKVIMLGLDDSGKTNILYKLKLGEKVTTIPTIGFNVEIIENNGWAKNIVIWDIGGNEKIRGLWKHYYEENENNKVNGLIWVYDISDNNRYKENRKELQKVLSNEKVDNNIPLLIYANKTDKNINNNDVNDFICGIKEYLNSRPYHVELCNINDGETYMNGLNWLYDHLI